jgi:hypothetical protein
VLTRSDLLEYLAHRRQDLGVEAVR